MARRIGLTMRTAEAMGYAEKRDCLAQDWPVFMAHVLPEVNWLPIPSLGTEITPYLQAWGLDGFILTGGNDVGEDQSRDRTEELILHFALEGKLPVLGICRGLQFIQKVFGGDLKPCLPGKHVAVHHPVRIIDPSWKMREDEDWRQVNSFHTQAVSLGDLAKPLRAFATTEDGWAEGIYHGEAQIAAVQWHPERVRPVAKEDQQLVRRFFGWEGL
jgi:gamma-glutamyl-gamma-aminobutyrate hydrolase PuuD